MEALSVELVWFVESVTLVWFVESVTLVWFALMVVPLVELTEGIEVFD